jgi:serine/threonine protein kinase
LIKEIGKGSYGLVISATERHSSLGVAIKKIPDVFRSREDASRILREIKILKQLPPHPNIVTLCDVLEPSNDPQHFKSIFIVFRQVSTDLQK